MIKNFILLFVLTALMVVCTEYAQQGMQFFLDAHDWLDGLLGHLFSDSQSGLIAKDFLGLFLLPLIIGLIPAIPFWIIKRRCMPGFFCIVWVVWLVQFGILIMDFKGPITFS